jgi:hypothetical protein
MHRSSAAPRNGAVQLANEVLYEAKQAARRKSQRLP